MKRSGQAPLDYGFHEFTSLDDLVEEVEGAGAAKSKGAAGGAGAGAAGAEAEESKAAPARRLPPATAVRLNNNALSSIEGLPAVLTKVVRDPLAVTWIDVSFNQLTRIEKVVTQFPNLQRLYMHANQITSLPDVDRLVELTSLRSLTLHGNPIQEKKLYRNYIISTVPWIRTLDFSAVTRKDLDIAITWRNMTKIKKKRREAADGGAGAAAGASGAAAS